MVSPVRVERDGAVTIVTLDRPDRRNAVDLATLIALGEMAAEVRTDGTRVLVLTGVPPAFSAGADLAGVEAGAFTTRLGEVLRALADLPIPVVAAVDGPALGAGLQLVSVCDVRMATPGSRFGIPAARLGLAIDQWTVDRVVQEFTGPIARAMLVAAEPFTAEQLAATGAVHRLGNLDDALVWAADLAQLAPLTIAAHKLALNVATGQAGVADEAERARVAAWNSADAEEGRQAFREKRRPQFIGR